MLIVYQNLYKFQSRVDYEVTCVGLRCTRLLQCVMKPFLNPVVSLADEGRLRSAAASLDAAPLLG